MRVLGEALIGRFVKKHGDAREWLENWLIVTRNADWQSIQDVRLDYPAADGGVRVASSARVTVFNVGGNKYRMIVNIAYAARLVIILELMTHAEYSKNHWKRRY